MKGKIRLFLVLALAVTMSLGMSVLAFAANHYDIGDGTGTYETDIIDIPEVSYVMLESNTISQIEMTVNVCINDELISAMSGTKTTCQGMYSFPAPTLSTFNALKPFLESYAGGGTAVPKFKVVWNGSEKTVTSYYYTDTFFPPAIFSDVTVDFHNSIKAGATWDSIKSKITIKTDPTDSIGIIQGNSGISEGAEGLIDSTTPLVEGKTYTLWLYLKSTNREFEAEDASGDPAKNVVLQNVEKTSERCSVMTESYDSYDYAEKGKVLSIKIVFTAKSSSTPGPNPPKPTPDPKPTPNPNPNPTPSSDPTQSDIPVKEPEEPLLRSYNGNKTIAKAGKNDNEAESEIGGICYMLQQGPLCNAAFAAATPTGFKEAFTFNFSLDTSIYHKTNYDRKRGLFVLNIPKAYQKKGRTFRIIGINKNGQTKVFSDSDMDDDTFTTTLDVEGYAFSLIYTDSTVKTEKAVTKGSSSSQNDNIYTVKSGDTLSAIARRLGVNLRKLIDRNDLDDPDKLSIGQKISY